MGKDPKKPDPPKEPMPNFDFGPAGDIGEVKVEAGDDEDDIDDDDNDDDEEDAQKKKENGEQD